MIRPALAPDAAAIVGIWNDVIRNTTITFTTIEKTRDDITDLIRSRPVFVLELDGGVCGFATFGPFRAGPGYRHAAEYTIYLVETAQGKGFGVGLLKAVESAALRENIDTLIAGIDGGNAAAQAFHKTQGFDTVGLFPGIGEKFGARHDLVLMQKKLVVRP